MENQKIINLLEDNDIESEKFATRKRYMINDQTSGSGNNVYGNGVDNKPIKYNTKVIKSNLCDYSDAYILVTGNINNKVVPAAGADVLRSIVFKNCAPFRTCSVSINNQFVEKTEKKLI